MKVTLGETTAYVDEKVAPLVEGLWRLTITTRFSCQSSTRQLNLMRHPREMFYVMFGGTEDLRAMLELFVGTPLDPTLRSSSWRYQLFPEFRDEPVMERRAVGLHPVVYIPVEQLPVVTHTVLVAAGRRAN